MRKYLGVLAGVAALCVMSWAQVPAPAPHPSSSSGPGPSSRANSDSRFHLQPPAAPPAPQYPRFELFVGGTYAEAGLFNAGHWAGLPGWDASLGANATSWLGFIVEGGQYFGTSRIPSLVPEPFPTWPNVFCPTLSPTFNVTTREYNFLFGAQFFRRKYGRWTPIGELLYGHQGVRGVATLRADLRAEIGTGRAIVAGGGLDRKISRRFAVRFKADYLQTAPFFDSRQAEAGQLPVLDGHCFGNVHKKKRTLEEETQPEP